MVTILTLGVLLLAAIIGLTVTAVFTDRDIWKAEVLTFGGMVVLAALGGLSWSSFRPRHRWRVNLEHNGEDRNA